MAITIIAALDADGAIGHDNDLPWERIPADLRHFRAATTGHAVVMGRKTYESIGKPLPNRTNIILTRSPSFSAPGCAVVSAPEKILEMAHGQEVFVIGGAEVFALFLPHARRLMLTRVKTHTGGSIRFPEVDWREWEQTAAILHPQGADSPYPLTFTSWVRAGAAS